MRCYFFLPGTDEAAGWGAGDADPWPAAGNAAKPLASSSAALASRTFRVVLSNTMAMTRWPCRAAVTAMEKPEAVM